MLVALAAVGLVSGFVLFNDISLQGERPLFAIIVLAFFGPALLGVSGYYMLHGANWARWLFCSGFTPYIAVLFAWDVKSSAMMHAIVLTGCASVLWTRRAGNFFHGRPRRSRRSPKRACPVEDVALNSAP